MVLYTRTGDRGETGLIGGPRVRKDAPRVEACGTVDELNSVLGLARAESLPDPIDALLLRLQGELFQVGAELAAPDPEAARTRAITAAHVRALEQQIDRWDQALGRLDHFVLPGGTRGAAQLHHARSVCRRAERRVVPLLQDSDHPVSPDLVAYLNRLSDLLFVLARATNAAASCPETIWEKP